MRAWRSTHASSISLLFSIFAEQSPYLYHPFIYRKKAFGNDTDRLLRALKMDLANFLADNLAFFQQFDKVNVYYDNGNPR